MTSSQQSHTLDSTIVQERERDTIVYAPADQSMIRALLECDSLGQVHLNRLLEYQSGERLKPPILEVKDNVLTAKATIDSMAIYIKLKERDTKSYRQSTSVQTKIVEVNHLTWWQQLWIKTGKILSVVAVGFILIKTLKNRIL